MNFIFNFHFDLKMPLIMFLSENGLPICIVDSNAFFLRMDSLVFNNTIHIIKIREMNTIKHDASIYSDANGILKMNVNDRVYDMLNDRDEIQKFLDV